MNQKVDIYLRLQILRYARRIADHASELGYTPTLVGPVPHAHHLGALLADTVLQAGLNYRTVVLPRIQYILTEYPGADNLASLLEISDRGAIGDLLQWRHPEKIERFQSLVSVLEREDVMSVADLRSWANSSVGRASMLEVRGVGLKTIDYLGCLLGADCIAVDRHIRKFTNEAGVSLEDYEDVNAVVSFAADLLGVSRRSLDAWIWRKVSRNEPQSAAA